jgi:hypothetical protein
MGAGSPGGSYVPSSDELAFKTLKDWFDAVKSLGGTADELYELLDDFAAWANTQNQTVKKIAWKYISDVRAGIESRRRERESKREKENKESKEGGKDSGGAGAGEPEGSTAPAGAVTEPRPTGPGRVVWTSPPAFPYQTTPSKGYEGRDHVTDHKHEVYGIETQLNLILSDGYKHVGSGGGWEMHIHAELKEPLDRFRDALRDVYEYPGPLEVNSCYRPLGTHVRKIEGIQKGDPGGRIDQTDGKGHWKGKSADLRTLPVRGYFGIPDSKANDYNYLDKIGEVVGLYRPFIETDELEGMHWRACNRTRKKFPTIIIDDATYGGNEYIP